MALSSKGTRRHLETHLKVSHTEIKQSFHYDHTRNEVGIIYERNITQEVSHRKWNIVSSPRCEDVLKGSTKRSRKGQSKQGTKVDAEAVLTPARHTGPHPRTIRGAELATQRT